MACIMGPIPPSAVSGYVQVQIEYGTADSRAPAFVLGKDGTCWVDLPKLLAFATPPAVKPGQADAGTDLARSVLAASGHPVSAEGVAR